MRLDWVIRTKCPFCRSPNELASEPDREEEKRPPENGDVSMCFTCGEFAIFDLSQEGNVRQPTSAEYDEIAAEPAYRDYRAAWLATMKEAGRET